MQSEVEPKQRLQWAHENPGETTCTITPYCNDKQVAIPGEFHFLWECLRVTYTIFWGTPSETGSLCNARELVCRKLVTKAVKVFNVGDEFLLHAFRAHLRASVCSILGISSPNEDIDYTANQQWLEEKAK